MIRTFLHCLSFLLPFSVAILAQVPKTMSYQGVLADTSGNAVADGNYDLTFKIYDVASGGTEIWMETQTIAVFDGIFNTILGSVAPLNLAFDQPYWLGVSVEGGTELSPRIELTSTAYSLRSANGGDGHSLDAADGDPVDAVYVDNDGRVGIGTIIPSEQLEITGNISMPATTGTAGAVYSGGNLFIHRFGSYNTFMGWHSGNLTMTGSHNTGFGDQTLTNITTGANNTAHGSFALVSNYTGNENTALGSQSLLLNTSGNDNTAVGFKTLNSFQLIGNQNTAIGANADVGSANLTNATAIGYGAIVNASNKIRFGNNNVTVVETDGTFKSLSTGIGLSLHNNTGLKINLFDDGTGIYGFGMAPAELQIGTYSSSKHISLGHYSGSSKSFVELMRVAGSGNVTGVYGNYHVASDIRLKKDIFTIPNALEKILALRGVNFRWKDGSDNGRLQMGLIAQEVEKVVPEVVHTADDSMQTKAVEYPFLVGLLVEGMKEQQKTIEKLETRMALYENILRELQAASSDGLNFKTAKGGLAHKN